MRKYTNWLLLGGLILSIALVGLFLGIKFLKNNSLDNKRPEQTFAMIKPDAVAALYTGKIIDRIEQEGFTIVALKKTTLTQKRAEDFYAEHHEKKFFPELIEFMTSGPVVLMVLSKKNAINAWRELMGSTNPEQAAPNTLRKLYGTNVGNNAVHGSDSKTSAQREITLIFPNLHEKE